MIQSFKENPRPSFATQILGDVGRGIGAFGNEFLQQKLSQRQQANENQALQRLTGQDFSGIPSEMKKLFIQEMLKQQTSQAREAQNLAGKVNTEAMKLEAKKQEKLVPLNAGLKKIQRMEEIGSKGNLGFGSGIKSAFSSDIREDRAEYERLGKSLISLASNIPIRNQREFETLAHDLYDPSLTDATRKGILNAMKQIIQDSLEEQQGSTTFASHEELEPKKQRRPLSSFGG